MNIEVQITEEMIQKAVKEVVRDKINALGLTHSDLYLMAKEEVCKFVHNTLSKEEIVELANKIPTDMVSNKIATNITDRIMEALTDN